MEFFIQGVKHWLVVISGATLSVFPHNAPPANLETPAPLTEHVITEVPVNQEKITISGEETYLGKGVAFRLSFPRDGGSIDGSFSGLCKGSLSGKYEGGDHGKAKIHADGNCNISFIKKAVEVDYTGQVNVSDGNTSGNWTGNLPFKKEGSLYLNFKPQ